MSCEPGRTSAYSEDLRWRMVWQREAIGLPRSVVASNLGVDESTVFRTLQLFHSTGSVAKRKYPTDRAARILTAPCQLLILDLVIQRPGIYLHEIQQELEDTLLVDVSISAICKFIHKSGFSRQKLRVVATQQDDFLREQYTLDVSVYSPQMFIFIDETGADRRNSLRKYGYSLRGKPAINNSLLYRGERVSAIACMSVCGIIDIKTVSGTSNGDTFYDFVQTHLIQHLLPFNGTNPHSVVVLDNCSIHHCTEVEATLRDIGVLVHYLPPYSPDLNPIEEAFSKVKTELKRIELGGIFDMETAVLASFGTITTDDCRGWISHSSVYNI